MATNFAHGHMENSHDRRLFAHFDYRPRTHRMKHRRCWMQIELEANNRQKELDRPEELELLRREVECPRNLGRIDTKENQDLLRLEAKCILGICFPCTLPRSIQDNDNLMRLLQHSSPPLASAALIARPPWHWKSGLKQPRYGKREP